MKVFVYGSFIQMAVITSIVSRTNFPGQGHIEDMQNIWWYMASFLKGKSVQVVYEIDQPTLARLDFLMNHGRFHQKDG